ncbi:MAG: hypothetical protein OXI75_05505 [Rhodospirillales bacterium]|nr:hypothetical protein [Rhodospirillales bacterium]
MTRLEKERYDPISSDYLRGGYRTDEFELTSVLLQEDRIIGSVKVETFFPPMDGEFHLSVPLAMIWLMQLGTIYSFLDIDAIRKDREVYLRDFSVKCRSRIVNLSDILLELKVTGRAERAGRHIFQSEYDIDVGSFTGRMSWFMDTKSFDKGA